MELGEQPVEAHQDPDRGARQQRDRRAAGDHRLLRQTPQRTFAAPEEHRGDVADDVDERDLMQAERRAHQVAYVAHVEYLALVEQRHDLPTVGDADVEGVGIVVAEVADDLAGRAVQLGALDAGDEVRVVLAERVFVDALLRGRDPYVREHEEDRDGRDEDEGGGRSEETHRLIILVR